MHWTTVLLFLLDPEVCVPRLRSIGPLLENTFADLMKKMRHLVTKFAINASGATLRSNLQLMRYVMEAISGSVVPLVMFTHNMVMTFGKGRHLMCMYFHSKTTENFVFSEMHGRPSNLLCFVTQYRFADI